MLYMLCPRFPCDASGLPSPGVEGGVDGREVSFEPPLDESLECEDRRDDDSGWRSLSDCCDVKAALDLFPSFVFLEGSISSSSDSSSSTKTFLLLCLWGLWWW